MSRQGVGTGSARDGQAVLAIDSLVLDAVADVDRSLLSWSLALSPRERLRACSRAAAALTRLRSAASPDR